MNRTGWIWFVVLAVLCVAGHAAGQEQDQELTIVKYGKLTVKSDDPEAKVFVDDTYMGRADTVIENILVGDHTISCRTDTRSATGKFPIKKNEVLRLEADFHQGVLISVAEREKAEQEKRAKAEQEKKAKAEVVKPQPKKVVVEAKREEKKAPEKKNPVEERRATYLNVVKLFFENETNGKVHVTSKINDKVISRYAEKKSGRGKYYRTMQNVLLCETGPCEEIMAASFVYTDEEGASDTFGLTWKQTVFNGITPSGTSRRDLLFCLNGSCQNLTDRDAGGAAMTEQTGRYQIVWAPSSLIVRRADIEKEILDAGGSVEAY